MIAVERIVVLEKADGSSDVAVTCSDNSGTVSTLTFSGNARSQLSVGPSGLHVSVNVDFAEPAGNIAPSDPFGLAP